FRRFRSRPGDARHSLRCDASPPKETAREDTRGESLETTLMRSRVRLLGSRKTRGSWPSPVPNSSRAPGRPRPAYGSRDRKSTRLNSSHVAISYAVFCLKKKKIKY